MSLVLSSWFVSENQWKLTEKPMKIVWKSKLNADTRYLNHSELWKQRQTKHESLKMKLSEGFLARIYKNEIIWW